LILTAGWHLCLVLYGLGAAAITAAQAAWWSSNQPIARNGPSWPTQPEPNDAPREKYERDTEACLQSCKNTLD
jgi:hypothetical protein